MQYWERRSGYNGSGGSGGDMDHGRFDRVKNLVIVLLTLLCIGMGIVGLRSATFRGKTEETFISTMKTQCGTAVNLATELSRNGGAGSETVLGRIRASLNGVETVNTLEQKLNGRYMVDPACFTELYSILDGYTKQLQSGSSTLKYQTDLSNGLENLKSLIDQLK